MLKQNACDGPVLDYQGRCFLAKVHAVGHIQRYGAVAEWLKAAVC